ncbi:uncharacterized protein N7515_007952 [Penicillium bovifimosum]|uniref:Uncharacterized protein n=1 Tax=Penicillium bovifimosum TaxID=126998 RepID=A0A9W9GN73_9EURO|nr:uncharacterized protein N7515_007952 [Penicillium bovifimosum]KAJ5124127.1 hypothetical protein N7515_007952 [Penicillium bovifimosum]
MHRVQHKQVVVAHDFLAEPADRQAKPRARTGLLAVTRPTPIGVGVRKTDIEAQGSHVLIDWL